MEEMTYHAKVIEVKDDGSLRVSPVPFSEKEYQDEMVLHTSNTKMYDRFGKNVDSSYFKKNQWVKFITNGIMTMSLPPQLNPSILYEHIPMVEFEAKIIDCNDKITVKVTDDCGSFVKGKLKLRFFDEPVIFNQEKEVLSMDDLEVEDKIHVFSIVSFFAKTPLIELYRVEKLTEVT